MNKIRELIDSMQSHLIVLFDELKELRKHLDLLSDEAPTVSSGTVVPLFSEISKQDSGTESITTPHKTEPPLEAKETETTSTAKVEPSTIDKPPPNDSEKHDSSISARASRLLDPIAHELQTGEAPAEVLAEYLQAAKDTLITKENPNERVAGDMDVVLKFLRARGKKGIRPEERENIMKRIRRWKASF
jgi:hypothetical protein